MLAKHYSRTTVLTRESPLPMAASLNAIKYTSLPHYGINSVLTDKQRMDGMMCDLDRPNGPTALA